jgi:hypothetical protein
VIACGEDRWVLWRRDRAPPDFLSWTLVGRGPEGLCADGDRMAY